MDRAPQRLLLRAQKQNIKHQSAELSEEHPQSLQPGVHQAISPDSQSTVKVGGSKNALNEGSTHGWVDECQLHEPRA